MISTITSAKQTQPPPRDEPSRVIGVRVEAASNTSELKNMRSLLPNGQCFKMTGSA